MPGCSVCTLPFSALCDIMLTILVCATHWLFMHFYMLAYMSMHESCLLVCCPYFNTMKFWTFNSNLHSSLADTTFCLLSYLFAFSLVCLLSCFFACHVYHAYLLYASFIDSLHLFLPLLVSSSCLCLCMYTHGVRVDGDRARSPKHKQKGRRRKHVDISQVAMFSSFRGLASPIYLYTLLKPPPSSFLSLLDGLYYVYHAMYHSSSSQEYGNPCLLSCTYILGHALGM